MTDLVDTIEIDDKEESIKNIKEVNSALNDIETFMKKESINRKNLIDEANENIDLHSKKMIEFNQKAKEYELLQNKYERLLKKYKLVETEAKKIVDEREILEQELMNLKRENINYSKQDTMLKSILKIIEEKVGIDMLSRATGISASKIKEYLD